jgi:hypothetical protein
MRDFVAKLGMAEDIEVERQFREANKGKAKQKSFQPTRRTIDEDDEVEKPDQEALKAHKWRPMNGQFRCCFHLSQMNMDPTDYQLIIKMCRTTSGAYDRLRGCPAKEVQPVDQNAWYALNGSLPAPPGISLLKEPWHFETDIKIKIIRSDDEGDSSSSGQDNILSRSTCKSSKIFSQNLFVHFHGINPSFPISILAFGSRSRPGSDRKNASSIRES